MKDIYLIKSNMKWWGILVSFIFYVNMLIIKEASCKILEKIQILGNMENCFVLKPAALLIKLLPFHGNLETWFWRVLEWDCSTNLFTSQMCSLTLHIIKQLYTSENEIFCKTPMVGITFLYYIIIRNIANCPNITIQDSLSSLCIFEFLSFCLFCLFFVFLSFGNGDLGQLRTCVSIE